LVARDALSVGAPADAVVRAQRAPSRELWADSLPEQARVLAMLLLYEDASRWARVEAVVARAAEAAVLLPPQERYLLTATAWLLDVGSAADVLSSGVAVGFPPLDGARYLWEHHWPRLLVDLVAQRFGSAHVAAALDLGAQLAVFDDLDACEGALADALTWAEATVGRHGGVLTVGERLREVAEHGDLDNPRACADREAVVRAAAARTEARLRCHARASRSDVVQQQRVAYSYA